MRPDYCPIGGEPCQSLCNEPCTRTPQRKPLTDEEIINKCLDSGFERNSLGWSFTYGKLDYHLLKLARAIETAHGIREKNDVAQATNS